MTPRALPCLLLVLGIGCTTEGAGIDDTAPRDTFPTGPYGTNEGEVVQNHRFLAPGGDELTLQELRADESSRLLLLVTAAGWCTACIEEQPSLQRLFDERADDGLRVVVSVFEDSEFSPARAEDAADWASDHSLSFPVVADPEFALRDYYDSSLTPMNMLVRAGSMTIERITTGWDPGLVESLVEALL